MTVVCQVIATVDRVGTVVWTSPRGVLTYGAGTDHLAGLADRSHRASSSPQQVLPTIKVAVVEMRRAHPRARWSRSSSTFPKPERD